tara:strand:+ start:3157 stop:4191 length:1035 start_codon:yes stop_codon:yes gene_type:complete
MRRFSVLVVAFGVMLSSFGSPVSAETNPDPLKRLRFTSNVTHVYDMPDVQVGDVMVFELAYDGSLFILASQTPGDPLCEPDATGCTAYNYNISGTWLLEYRRNGEVVHSEDGTFATLVVLEGGDDDFGGLARDKFYVYEDTSKIDDVIRFEDFDGDWNAGNVDLNTMRDMAVRNDLWDANFFMKNWPVGSYQYDYTTADDYARVSIPAGLIFDANGGVGGPDRISGDPEEVVTVPATEPTRDGYQFASWNTASDGSGVAYAPDSPFTLGTETDVETLYARWTEPVLTIIAPETSVPETTDVSTPSDVTLPATGSSGGSMNPVLFVLGLGGLLMLFGRRRTPDRQ